MSAFCLVRLDLSSVISLFNYLFSIRILETVIWMSTSISFSSERLGSSTAVSSAGDSVSTVSSTCSPCLLVSLLLVRLLLSLVHLVFAFLPVCSPAGSGGFSALVC